MKIAKVSPLYESFPPKRYGGTESVSYLTEETDYEECGFIVKNREGAAQALESIDRMPV